MYVLVVIERYFLSAFWRLIFREGRNFYQNCGGIIVVKEGMSTKKIIYFACTCNIVRRKPLTSCSFMFEKRTFFN